MSGQGSVVLQTDLLGPLRVPYGLADPRSAGRVVAPGQSVGVAAFLRLAVTAPGVVALGYRRPADLWRNNATVRLFAAATAAAGQGREAQKHADPA